MKTLSRCLTASVLAVLVGLGCSGSSTTTAAPPGADQACSDFARARCDKLAACEPTAVPARYGDDTTCVAREKLACTSSLAAAGTGATPQTVEACIAAFPAYACADFVNNNPPAVCQSQKGPGANGQACAFNAQCQSAFCAVAKGAACGACADPPKVGDSCASVTSCGYDLTCSKSTETCTKWGAVGDACTRSDATCGFGLGCAGTTEAAPAGTCQPLAKAGEGCGAKQNAVCDSSAGLTCANGICELLTQAGPGEACGKLAADAGQAMCVAASSCVTPDAGLPGICQGPGGDDQPCNTADERMGCMAPARCVGTASEAGVVGTCKLPSAASCI